MESLLKMMQFEPSYSCIGTLNSELGANKINSGQESLACNKTNKTEPYTTEQKSEINIYKSSKTLILL